ncbi:hypothetical protein RB600_007851 [Gaeumannomyces tritici]
MALLNPTFVCGVLVLLYLSTFVLFAVLRIITGVSVQRIGYFSLRRLAYTPRDGLKIEIRGLGLNVHRPTFAQPTWLSIVVKELVVTVDIQVLEGGKAGIGTASHDDDDDDEYGQGEGPPSRLARHDTTPRPSAPQPGITRRSTGGPPRSELWKRLTRLKERIKRLHRNVNWLRMVDVVATSSGLNIVGVGNVQVGSLTVAVDTRRKMVDRARFFLQSRGRRRQEKHQAEWITTLRSVLFTPEGRESMEILDNATLNVHGFLHDASDGLQDAAVALKLGRIHLPYDEIQLCADLYKQCRSRAAQTPADAGGGLGSVDEIMQEIEIPGSTDQELMQTVSDSKEFVSSLLRGIKEVQFAVSFVGLTKKIEHVKTTGAPVLLNASMKEVGIDLHRLDPKSPAHRMYFPSTDIAHEALMAALSISIGVDDGQGAPQRLAYIPMATTTVRTTLPSKTVELSGHGSAEQRNANILFANSVVTSPSVDLDPSHLPLLLAMLRPRSRKPGARNKKRHILISRLLPKASIKFTMHEPVVRISLPPVQKQADPDDFDLIISSISSISLDMESFHSAVEDLHYSLASSMRIQTHNLYYQTASGSRFDVLETESFDLKIQLGASPDVHIVATGNLQTFAFKMVRPEISDGLHQIARQLRLKTGPEGHVSSSRPKQNFLRAMPSWLLHFQIQASDFSIEVAGIDEDISENSRGVALHLESWSAEYRAQRLDGLQRQPSRRRASSRASSMTEADLLKTVPLSPRKRFQNAGDGRRIAVHVRGLEAFVVESSEKGEVDPFVNMPRFEVACSTLSDNQGPVFHLHSNVRTLLVQYSLYRHYAVGVATVVLRKAFARPSHGPGDDPAPSSGGAPAKTTNDLLSPPTSSDYLSGGDDAHGKPAKELVAIDVKAALVQIKADMPADPPIMLQIHGLEAGRHRWSPPFFHSKLIRLYAEAPRMRRVWARVLSVKNGRLDYRESRKKLASGGYKDEKLFDVVTDAIRFAVPHELIFNKVSDNIINVFKSVQQLHHRFRTGTNGYILDKGPESPKSIPKVSLRSRTFLFELEDGAFEWKLGMIYRTGRLEQMQRLAREEAFQVKVKKIHEEELKRESTKFRTRSATRSGRSKYDGSPGRRSHSEDGRPRSSSESQLRGPAPRYEPDDAGLGMSGRARVSIKEARRRLDEHNSHSWKRRIDRHFAAARNSMSEFRSLFWGADHLPDDVDDDEHILEVPQRPALMSTLVHDLHFVVDKPSFPSRDLPDFLHKVGKGMPKDMKYSLLVPMNVAVDMGEVKVSLRDYPLPLLHVPSLKAGQSPRLSALSLKTDFVIAEEFHGSESTRRVRVTIIPPKEPSPESLGNGGFAIDVRRTVGPVKSYSDINVDINTALPTKLTWGPCYQPAIQDMMMAIESFTKPQLDPSERVGFWDKIRLNLHSRVRVAWKADGDVHFALKGTRDPYQVTGNGAGFLMCWRNDVRWNVHVDDDPKRFMTVDSGEYVLAVPDYSSYARGAARRAADPGAMSTEDSHKSGAAFQKVIMKLSGRVQWLAGLVFEQAIQDGKRRFDFKPHYDVVLKTPQFAKPTGDKPYDALRGFRSQHIHLSVAVCAPVDREWTTANPEPSRSYNAVHLTPRFFTHFFAWWSLFGGGTMSLPIRQGSLWPGREKNSKKFGRHLATIKYNLLLAPLFLSHIYRHKDAEDPSEMAVQATGIKVRFDSFMLDLHQRREEFNTREKGSGKSHQARTTGMKIHAGQLDLASVDVRAVSANIRSAAAESINENSLPGLDHGDDDADLSRFTIPDHDFSWIDMDDFVELDTPMRAESNAETKILPLMFAPRVTYFRQTDIGGVIAGDTTRSSSFGEEETHLCIMSRDDEPRRVQEQLIRKRLAPLSEQIEANIRTLGELELRLIKTDHQDADLKTQFEQLTRHGQVLEDKKKFLESMLQQMQQSRRAEESGGGGGESRERSDTSVSIPLSEGSISLPSGAEFASDFKNRFVVHNMQLKWNNLLRNIILRYSHQVSQRRGFVYYLSRPAIKFILDIVEEQNKTKASRPTNASTPAPSGATASPDPGGMDQDTTREIEDTIRRMMQDAKRFEGTHGRAAGAGEVPGGVSIGDLTGGIADGFTPQNSYHVRLIAPQIQMQSAKNTKHVVLVTAKGMELKVVEVLDKDRVSDSVSGLVQRRFMVSMDSTQFFVTHQKWFSTQLLSASSGSTYGTPLGTLWPPWVPMEVMFDFQTSPLGFRRVVQKTSATLRYDKYNTLRLKYNDEVNNTGAGGEANSTESSPHEAPAEQRMDNLWVEFPQARALCNSSQYYAMYVIVLDLLMYSEPTEKHRSERLEKIMLASDFSDLRGAPEMVVKLQDRIRQLQDIRTHFQVHAKHLDRRSWEHRMALERDLATCEDELFFTMKAITSSQGKYEAATQNNALLKWSISAREIVWHLIRDNSEPLVELQLKDVEYDRTDNADGSHSNEVRVGKILGLNLLQDAIYPEMIAPYVDERNGGAAPASATSTSMATSSLAASLAAAAVAKARSSSADTGSQPMIQVRWNMLEAIAGIPVMSHFEVNLFPLKIQLEREVGKKLFEYIFPDMDKDRQAAAAAAAAVAASSKGDSPFTLRGAGPDHDEGGDEPLAGGGHSYGHHQQYLSDRDASAAFDTRAGSLELRLRPTLTSDAQAVGPKSKAVSVHSVETGHSFRLFRSSATGATSRTPSKKPSAESLRSFGTPRPGIGRTTTGFSSIGGESKKGSSRFALRSRGQGAGEDKADKPSDDLTKMITRASSYMTFAYIKLPSVVLCLSYKGKGDRNLEDVHDFVFRLPTIEYRNKTWSNLDLALAFKSRVIKALISHTGAIIGNKFSRHRPNMAQQSKLRELASSSVLLMGPAVAESRDNSGDDSSSLVDYSRSPPRSLRSSDSSIPVPRGISRSPSVASGSRGTSTNGAPSSSSGPVVPAFLMMTPPTPKEGQAPGFPSSSNGSGNATPSSGDSLRPKSVGSMRLFNGVSNEAPERRRTALGGMRDRLTAFARRKDRESSSADPQGPREDEGSGVDAPDDSEEEGGRHPDGSLTTRPTRGPGRGRLSQ